jgi:hypothetical protein
MKSNPVCAGAVEQCNGVYVLTLSLLFARFYDTLELLFVSPYNHAFTISGEDI